MYGEMNATCEPVAPSGNCQIKPPIATMSESINEILEMSNDLSDICYKIDHFLFRSDNTPCADKMEISCMLDAAIVSKNTLLRTINHLHVIAEKLGM